jgi:hypothetical protein
MKTTVVSSVIVLAVGLLPAGCASIINGRNADIAIDSYPTNAHVIIHDNDGRQVASLDTPGVVSLKRNRRYFLPARYTATIEAPGYAPTDVPIRYTVNPWIAGNIVIGGIPGLIVDNATGAAWKPKESEIHRQLSPLGVPTQEMYSSNQPPATSAPEQDTRIASRPPQTSPQTTTSGTSGGSAYQPASSKAWIPIHWERQEQFAERALESPNERIQAEGATARSNLH